MKANCWFGRHDVRVCEVPEPQLLNPRDAVVRVTLTAICGSDLHLYDGHVPTMKEGDILGHEFMGEVVTVGSGVESLAPGDRVVVPFAISCGRCFYCQRGLWSLCDNSNPNARLAAELYGFACAGLFGYSHMMGGYAGGQAEMVRVPFADVGPLKVPAGLSDEQALFLSDIFPTGYMAAENCEIQPGDVIAVWGCGPVGQFAARSALLLGAERVIAIDREPARLSMAAASGAETIDFSLEDVTLRLTDMTGGRGPDACIDCVGLEAYGRSPDALYDRARTTLGMATDRPTALRQAVRACRKGGVVSIPGVYGGFVDKIPLGSAFNKGLTFKMGQTHVQRYMELLLQLVLQGRIDPSFVITHRVPLSFAPEAYDLFKHKRDGCVKVVLTP
jgi:threonine dehydrogenase-like Zn-dependent dehydrogenase